MEAPLSLKKLLILSIATDALLVVCLALVWFIGAN